MTKSDKVALVDAAFRRDDHKEFARLLRKYPECRYDEAGDDWWMDSAAMNGKLWAVKLLVEQGADVNKPSNSTDSVPSPEGPVDKAAGSGNVELVRYMLDRGARINHSIKGTTRCFALLRAARKGHLEIVKLLVERGAEINAVWAEKTALDHALNYDQNEVIAYLQSVGGKYAVDLGNVS
jgi:ankyrin repeat protein